MTKKYYKLVNPDIEDNFFILSIAQTNWWAILAHGIRLAAWFNGLDPFSHSALGYFRKGTMYIIEMKGEGARIKPFDFLFGEKSNFSGKIEGYLTPYSATLEKVAELLERNSHFIYNVPLAIKSELEFLSIKKGTEDSFCSDMVIDDLEFISNKDLFEGDNEKFDPSELDLYVNRKLQYKKIFTYEI